VTFTKGLDAVALFDSCTHKVKRVTEALERKLED
jgi:hypothetical protein